MYRIWTLTKTALAFEPCHVSSIFAFWMYDHVESEFACKLLPQAFAGSCRVGLSRHCKDALKWRPQDLNLRS